MKVQVIQSTASYLLSIVPAAIDAFKWSWRWWSNEDSTGSGSCKNFMKYSFLGVWQYNMHLAAKWGPPLETT